MKPTLDISGYMKTKNYKYARKYFYFKSFTRDHMPTYSYTN